MRAGRLPCPGAADALQARFRALAQFQASEDPHGRKHGARRAVGWFSEAWPYLNRGWNSGRTAGEGGLRVLVSNAHNGPFTENGAGNERKRGLLWRSAALADAQNGGLDNLLDVRLRYET